MWLWFFAKRRNLRRVGACGVPNVQVVQWWSITAQRWTAALANATPSISVRTRYRADDSGGGTVRYGTDRGSVYGVLVGRGPTSSVLLE